MKAKVIPIFVFLFFCAHAKAQVLGRFYYTDHWELTKKDSARYFRVCVYDTTAGVFAGPVKDMLTNGRTKMTGAYRGGVKQGEFTLYYDNGQIESTGQFNANIRTGLWKYFYPNGKPRMEVNFGDEMKIIFLNDSITGKPIVTDGNGEWQEVYEEYVLTDKVHLKGKLKDHRKHGEWTCWLSNGTKLSEEVYKDGEFVKGFTYVDGKRYEARQQPNNQLMVPYKFLTTENFVATHAVQLSDYPFLLKIFRDNEVVSKPKKSTEEVFKIVEETATPDGGMAAFYNEVAKIMRFPTAARKKRVGGKVFVEFMVGVDGKLNNINVVQGVSPELDKEAVRAVTEAGKKVKWIPGKTNGEPVAQRLVLPVEFKLAY